MGLIAAIYCNCYETGRLRTQPPQPELIYVDDNGSLACQTIEQFWEFDDWFTNHACEHKRGEALCHYIGNMALVAFLRGELEKNADAFPIILSKVIYSGIHGGDYISVDEVEKMQKEVAKLQNVHSDNPEEEKFLREFETQMKELVECSLQMKKPIAF